MIHHQLAHFALIHTVRFIIIDSQNKLQSAWVSVHPSIPVVLPDQTSFVSDLRIVTVGVDGPRHLNG